MAISKKKVTLALAMLSKVLSKFITLKIQMPITNQIVFYPPCQCSISL